MLRGFAAAALFCALLTLSGCQPPHEVYLINNTGNTIQILRSTTRWEDHTGKVYTETWRPMWNWPFLIDQGIGRRVRGAHGQVRILHVRAGRCRFSYEAPMWNLYDDAGWRGFEFNFWHTTLQLEGDERLYVVAARIAEDHRPKAVDVAPFIAIQPDGFPVEPSSRVCQRR